MKPFLLLIVLTGLLLQACENAPVRRQEMIAQHPEWSPEYAKLIEEGYLAKGMDQDQVKAAWGRPCWTCTGTTKGDWGEAWEYATQVVFFGPDGKVIRWEKK
ncbi:MAG: hypothetical protein ACU84J_05435 [Gammaproteobacteria bacterium]